MKAISTLYHDTINHCYCDYPAPGAKRRDSRVNNGKPFEVHHADGTTTTAYGFGEKQFTYSMQELMEAKEAYQAKRAYLNERNKLLEQLKDVDLDTLRTLVELVKKSA